MEKNSTTFISPKDLHTCPGLEHFKARTVRHLIFNAGKNGLAEAGAVVKLGRRKVLIDTARFVAWLEKHRI